MEAPCYYKLLDDPEKKILSFLSVKDIWHMLQVNKAKSRFADYYAERLLEFYQNAFKMSCLEKHLSQIMIDGSLSNYFNAFVPLEWLTVIQAGELDSLSNLVRSARESIYSKDLVSDEDIQQIPQNQEFLLPCLGSQTIKDFLSAPYEDRENILEERKKRLVVAKRYRQVEGTYTLLLLFLLVHRSSEESALLFVADGRLSRWLNSSGIDGLTCQSYEEKLLSNLIECSLGKHKLSSKHSYDKEVTLQYIASEILYRLTDNVCWSILDKNDQGPVLVDAIIRQCFPIIDSFGPRALERVIEENSNEEMMLLELLKRFGSERLSRILASKSLAIQSFQIIVVSCDLFMTKLLSELTVEQLCEMITLLCHEGLGYLLGSKPFVTFFKKFDSWDVLSKSTLFDKFYAQELLRFAAINIKAVPCIVEKGYLNSKFREVKDYIEFCLRYMRVQAVPEAIRREIMSTVKPCFTVWERTTTDKDNELKYWRLLLETEKLKDNDLVWLKEQCEQEKPIIHTEILQKTMDLQNERDQKKQVNALKESNNPILLSDVPPSTALKTVSLPPALPSSEQPISSPERKNVQEAVRPTPKKQLQNQENKKQNNNYSLIAMSILKGFFVGLLITGVAILLMMFINYQLNVPLPETINNLWIAGIAGIFADIVATACFLVDAKVFEPVNSGSTNQKADGPQPFNIPAQVTPTDPSYGNETFSPGDKTADTPKRSAQQTYVQASLDVDRPNNLANSLY